MGLYVSISKNGVQFGDSQEEYPFGKTLIDFIHLETESIKMLINQHKNALRNEENIENFKPFASNQVLYLINNIKKMCPYFGVFEEDKALMTAFKNKNIYSVFDEYLSFFKGLENIQNIFAQAIYYCFEINDVFKGFTTLERYYFFIGNINRGFFNYGDNINLSYGLVNHSGFDVYDKLEKLGIYNDLCRVETLPDKSGKYLINTLDGRIYDIRQILNIFKSNNIEIIESAKVSTLEEICFLEFQKMMMNNVTIKKCKNCSKYFIVTDLKAEYCKRILKDKFKTCSDVGSDRTFNKKLKEDPALNEYNRAYKTHFARVRSGKRKKMTQKEFNEWYINAKSKLEETRGGKLSLDKFKEWLKI